MNDEDFHDGLQQFMNCTHSLEIGQKVEEANKWLYNFLSSEYCIFVALHILENPFSGYADYIALNAVNSLLRNHRWVNANAAILQRIKMVF
jgi:hypothetical protein